MFQRNFKLCDFPVHSVCFLTSVCFCSEQKFHPFFTIVPNFKNFHRQLSKTFVIEI